MQAALYYGQEDVRVESIDPQPLRPDAVRVDVTACGICGSDLHEYTAGPIFVPEDPHPMTGASIPLRMGHEFAGTVDETGADVTELAAGDPVAINPIRSCGTCRYCRAGKQHLCESVALVGVSADGGGFAEQSVVPAGNAVPLPESVPPRIGALVEPFSVALHAVRQSELAGGDSAAVFGCGPIGLAILQVLRATGATDVFAVEPRDARRELAADFGATPIDPTETGAVKRIKSATGDGTDVAFEVAGIEQTYNDAISSTVRDGTVVVVSMFEEAIRTHPNTVVMAERTVKGTMSYLGSERSDGEFRSVVDLFASGRLDPERLVTETIGLADVESGFRSLGTPEDEQIKILVEC
jgi:(R,R)-butanediol dehydrogenase/meso-butanediol dehydrogenase/diacetyl reductase